MSKAPAIIDMEEFTESINMIIYGDSGVGKTVMAGTCPNALFLAIEDGTISAKRQGSTAELWPVKKWDDLSEAHDWLSDNTSAYDWVIIDSATAMQKLCMRGILDKNLEDNKSRDPDIPQIQDWQKYYNMFTRFINAFNELPINVLYTATTMQGEDEEGETIVLPELASPSHSPLRESQAFCASVAVVGYYKRVQGKDGESDVSRKLLFSYNPPYFAKDRYDVFPRWVTVTKGEEMLTTMADIQRRIEKPKTKPTTAVRKRRTAKRTSASK